MNSQCIFPAFDVTNGYIELGICSLVMHISVAVVELVLMSNIPLTFLVFVCYLLHHKPVNPTLSHL